jgi:hypothetical protein
LWLALSGIFLSAGLIIISIYYSYSVINRFDTKIIPGFKMVLPVLVFLFTLLAYRGIKKDDRLVKSYDRLR